jgi:hypothetical protein
MVRILKEAGARDSCRNFFKTLKTLPPVSQYLLFKKVLLNYLHERSFYTVDEIFNV